MRTLTSFVLACGLAAAPLAHAQVEDVVAPAAPEVAEQSGPTGFWRTISDTNGEPRALIEIVEAGDGTMEAYVRDSLVPGEDPMRPCTECKGELEGAPMLGMRIMWDMEPDEDDEGKWRGGRILDPDTGNVYKSKFELQGGGEALRVRGYIGISALGRSQTWERAEAPADLPALPGEPGSDPSVLPANQEETTL